MYLPENDSTDYLSLVAPNSSTFQRQQQQKSSPYLPNHCKFSFKIMPSKLAETGYAESDAVMRGETPWKIFVKAAGKNLYPYIHVGIADHNNVEEIAYKIILQGIKPEYDEERQDIVKVTEGTPQQLQCSEKIWYYSLFDQDEHETPLIFDVYIRYRNPGEKYVPYFAPYEMHQRKQHRLKHKPSTDMAPDDIPDYDFTDLFTNETSIFSTAFYIGIFCILLNSWFNINLFAHFLEIVCFLLSLVFILVGYVLDLIVSPSIFNHTVSHPPASASSVFDYNVVVPKFDD